MNRLASGDAASQRLWTILAVLLLILAGATVAQWYERAESLDARDAAAPSPGSGGERRIDLEPSLPPSENVAVRQVPGSEGGDETGVVLRDWTSSASLQNVPVVCESESGRQVSRTTDVEGFLPLPSGDWRIDATAAGLWPVANGVRVDVGKVPIWMQKPIALVVMVTTVGGAPLQSSRAQLYRNGDSVGVAVTTAADGLAALDPTWFEASSRVLVSHPTHAPAWVALGADVATGVLEVQLHPVSSHWSLLVRDMQGSPISGVTMSVRDATGAAPAIALGETDVDGRLDVSGSWMFDGFRWEFGGAAFAARQDPPPWNDELLHGQEFELSLPRRCEGRLLVSSVPQGLLEWRFMDAAPRRSGVGIMFQSALRQPVNGAVAAVMPKQWPTRVECRRNAELLWAESIEVDADNWTVEVQLSRPVPRRRIFMRSQISGIRSVSNGERVIFPEQDREGPPSSVHFLSFEVGCGAESVRLTFDTGIQCLLIGQPGNDDVVIAVGHPDLVPVEFRVEDLDGRPLPDVALRVARVADPPVETGTPGWQYVLTANVLRGTVSLDGVVRCRLPAGRYGVEFEQLSFRDALGASWAPHERVEVFASPPSSGPFVVRTAKPRRVMVKLKPTAGGTLPGFWQLEADGITATFGGGSCDVWLRPEVDELRVLDLTGKELGTAHVANADTDVVVLVRSPEQR